MKQNKLNIDLVTADANYLNSAIDALEVYVCSEFNVNKITVTDIDRLNGLIVSIKQLALKHADEMNQYPSWGENK